MKKLVFLLILVFTASISAADPMHAEGFEEEDKKAPVNKNLEWGKNTAKCPFVSVMPPEIVQPLDCFRCHEEGNMDIKESSFDTGRYYRCPNDLEPRYVDGKLDHMYFLNWKVDHEAVTEVFAYMDKHPELPRKIVFEMNGPGGHAFNGMKIANTLMSHWDDYEVITMVDGFALSAHFLMLAGGEHRICSRGAELMWHEISYFEWLERVTPSGTADKKEMMDHLQKNANDFLASRSRLTSDEINEKITTNRIGWWINGDEAFRSGFCDEVIN